MTTREGDTVASVVSSGTRNEMQRGGLPALFPVATHFELSCFDSANVRHYWTDATASLVNAPTLSGGATYVTATLAIMASRTA